jgi:hypothetical protein
MEGHENRSYRESFDCIEQEIRNQRYFPNPEPEKQATGTPDAKKQDRAETDQVLPVQDPAGSNSQREGSHKEPEHDGSRSMRGGNSNGGPAAVLKFAKSKLEKLEKAKAKQLLMEQKQAEQRSSGSGHEDPQASRSQQTQQKGHPSPREQPAGEGGRAIASEVRLRAASSLLNSSSPSSVASSQRSSSTSTSTSTSTGTETGTGVDIPSPSATRVKSAGTQVGDGSVDRILIAQKRAPRGSVANEVIAVAEAAAATAAAATAPGTGAKAANTADSLTERPFVRAPASKMFRSSSKGDSSMKGKVEEDEEEEEEEEEEEDEEEEEETGAEAEAEDEDEDDETQEKQSAPIGDFVAVKPEWRTRARGDSASGASGGVGSSLSLSSSLSSASSSLSSHGGTHHEIVVGSGMSGADEDSAASSSSSSSEWERSGSNGLSSAKMAEVQRVGGTGVSGLPTVPLGKMGAHAQRTKPMAIKPSATMHVASTFAKEDGAGLSVSPAGQGAMSEYEEHVQNRMGHLEKRDGATLRTFDEDEHGDEEDHNQIDPEMATVMQVGSPPKVGAGVPRLHLERMKALRSPHGSEDGTSPSPVFLGTLSPDPTKMMDISSPRSAFSRHSSRSDLASMCLATRAEESAAAVAAGKKGALPTPSMQRSVSC